MTDTTPLISATNLHKTYKMGRVRVPVLRGLSVGADKGEWIAILGASGSGKSTLLHLLGGLDRPDRVLEACPACRCDLRGQPSRSKACAECGATLPDAKDWRASTTIEFDGTTLGSMSRGELDRFRATQVGFVFQFYHLLPELRVLENVTVGAMVRHGLLGFMGQRARVNRRGKDLLDAFGLGHRLRHRPGELSGGERQRVAIARALVNEPRVLLADEPTGNLDRKTGDAILDSLADLRERLGLTIIMVTHDQHVADRADRVIRLADGVIAGSEGGSAEETAASHG